MASATHMKDEIREGTQNVKDKTEDMIEKGKQGLQQAADKGRDMAQQAADKAKEMGTAVRDRADAGVSSVGSGMRNAADAIKSHTPQSGVLGQAAATVTDTLDSTGRYLEEHGVSGAAEDLTGMIRKHPVPSVLIGIGLGILLGQFMNSSRR